MVGKVSHLKHLSEFAEKWFIPPSERHTLTPKLSDLIGIESLKPISAN